MTRQSNQFIEFLHPDGVFEICLIGTKTPKSDLWEGYAKGAKPIVTGWFNDREAALKIIQGVNGAAKAVYVTLNPCNSALTGRSNNRLKAGVSRTQDTHVFWITFWRRFFLWS